MNNKGNNREYCAKIPALELDEINSNLKLLDGWSYDEKDKTIKKSFSFKGFYGAIGFVNAVAYIAQKHNHHPDIKISYNTVDIYYQTHSSNAVTELDFILAKKIDAL